VDLRAFDANVAYVIGCAQGSGKTVRLGTKSIRCEPLLRRIREASSLYQGFLTYTVEETAFLAGKGHDDFLVAYPSVQPSDLDLLTRLTREGKRLSVMIDSLDHLTALSDAGARAGVPLAACLEVDLAYRPLPAIHLGLRRSPIRTPEQAVQLARRAQDLRGVRLDGLMGYEGHIAGTSDALPGKPLHNLLLRAVKAASVRELTRRRGAIVQALREAGVQLRVVNGGGSGSLRSTLRDPSVTEVTVGSGFFAPGLFHHFAQVRYQPSAYFALQVVRNPAPGMIACAGGGYIASGPTAPEKAPLPVLPAGLRYLPLEGAGEVSTPLRLPAEGPALSLGDPVFFQHAKAGELCERFHELHLVQDGAMLGTVPTYRGEGMTCL
jgi:D-serine deaminase-like pyridoxal phosphate-dependent protein